DRRAAVADSHDRSAPALHLSRRDPSRREPRSHTQRRSRVRPRSLGSYALAITRASCDAGPSPSHGFSRSCSIALSPPPPTFYSRCRRGRWSARVVGVKELGEPFIEEPDDLGRRFPPWTGGLTLRMPYARENGRGHPGRYGRALHAQSDRPDAVGP